MEVAVIGAGFAGLSAAYQLLKKGHTVHIFEKESQPGGLAGGFKEQSWDWTLEEHYHHLFTSDSTILSLAKEIGVSIVTIRPKTSIYIDGQIYQLDSPLKLLQFSKLSIIERLRMAATLAIFRYNPYWKFLEKYRATAVLPKLMGKRGYELIWEPQLLNKFGKYKDTISLAWFWARIRKRTTSLAYPEGGFLKFAQSLANSIREKGGKIDFNCEITNISGGSQPSIQIKDSEDNLTTQLFDRVIVTLPSTLFTKIAPELSTEYRQKTANLKSLGAVNLVLRLNKPFFLEKTYWLSVCDSTSPVMAIVEHTNFMDRKNYHNEYLLYLGNYLSTDDPKYKMNGDQLLALFDPFLKKINPSYHLSLIAYRLSKAPFAQPIVPINYSKIIPPMQTPLQNVYLANMEQVYPWDRGTNYAIEQGEKVALLAISVK